VCHARNSEREKGQRFGGSKGVGIGDLGRCGSVVGGRAEAMGERVGGAVSRRMERLQGGINRKGVRRLSFSASMSEAQRAFAVLGVSVCVGRGVFPGRSDGLWGLCWGGGGRVGVWE